MKGILKNLVSTVAPTIGTALSGPLGGMAMGKIAEVLGVSNDQKSVQQAIKNATPEQMMELKKAEQEFEAQMKKLDVDVFKLENVTINDGYNHPLDKK